jgi:hypothetical protein
MATFRLAKQWARVNPNPVWNEFAEQTILANATPAKCSLTPRQFEYWKISSISPTLRTSWAKVPSVGRPVP